MPNDRQFQPKTKIVATRDVKGYRATILDVSGLSGFRSTLDVLALLNSYAALLDPRTIVVKSGALLNLARRLEARS